MKNERYPRHNSDLGKRNSVEGSKIQAKVSTDFEAVEFRDCRTNIAGGLRHEQRMGEMYVWLNFPNSSNHKIPNSNKIHICDRDCKTLLLAPLVHYDKESDM
jgi:hypothetical protein